MDLGRWRRRSGTAFAEAGFILVLGLTLTAVAWWALDRQARSFSEQRFSTIAGEVAGSVVKRMGDYEQILRGAAALVKASERVTRHEWQTYVTHLAVERAYPGIQGIGFAVHVPGERVAEHEREVRAEGFPDYAVQPPGVRPDTFPIIFLEPFDERNRRAFGFDMFSQPIRNAAMTRARDTGAPALSGRVTLVQETGESVQAGTLLYLPVYREGADLSTVGGRREAIVGFVYSPFRMDDLTLGILGDRIGDVGLRLYDGSVAPGNLLFDRGAAEPKPRRRVLAVEVSGRTWVLEVTARPRLEKALATEYPQLVLVAGMIISLLLMWLAQARVRERARILALERSNRDLAEARLSAERARQDAEAANMAKSRFLAAASHDIRQPVQSMMLLIEVLGQQLAGHDAAHLVEPLDKSLDALRVLLHGLLDISKLDAGVVEVRVEAIDLGDLFGRLGSEYRIRADAQGLRLRWVPTRAWARTDKALIERILRNLIENALRYTPSGRILLGCRRRGDGLRIELHDTGIGIPADQVDHIFHEFHQVGNPERDRTQGLGLGLAIVRRLGEMLGHRIEVRSRLGHGSCFAVILPAATPMTADADTAAPLQIVDGGLALVIDDEALLRDSFRHLLQAWGLRVVTAGSADEALSVLAGEVPTVILADYRLRGGELGTAAIARVRAALRTRVPAVVITGDTAPERIAEADKSGQPILHKPVSAANLRAAILRATGQTVA